MTLKLYTIQKLVAEYPFTAEALYRQIARGQLKCRRRGRRIFIKPADFEAWLARRQVSGVGRQTWRRFAQLGKLDKLSLRLIQIGSLLVLFGLLLAAFLKPVHAANIPTGQSDSAVVGLSADHGLACPDGYRTVRVKSDDSEPVKLTGGAVISYPATSGGLTCFKVKQ